MKKYIPRILALSAAALLAACGNNGGEEPVIPPTLSLEPATITVSVEGTTGTTAITSDGGPLSAEVAEADKTWLKAEMSGRTIVVTALADNPSMENVRTGKVTVYAGEAPNQSSAELTVEQGPTSITDTYFNPRNLLLDNVVDDQADVTVGVAGSAFSFTIPTADQQWLEATQSGSVVTFKVKALNDGYTARTSNVTFTFSDPSISPNTAVFPVTQGGMPIPTLDIPAAQLGLSIDNPAGSSANIAVTTNQAALDFNYNGNDSWLEASFDAAEGRITVTAKTKNPNAEERTGTIDVSVGSGSYLVSIPLAVAQAVNPAGGYPRVGDAYDKDGVKGVIFWVDPEDASKAKIVSATRTDPPNVWCTNTNVTLTGGTSGILNSFAVPGTSETSGQANMTAIENFAATITAPAGAVSEFKAYHFCKTMSATENWYLPSNEELRSLITAYYGASSFDAIPDKSPETMRTDATPADLAALAARDAFDAKLIALGGHKITVDEGGDGDTYLSSTQNSANAVQVGYVCAGKRRLSNAAKYASRPTRYARCALDVTLEVIEND